MIVKKFLSVAKLASTVYETDNCFAARGCGSKVSLLAGYIDSTHFFCRVSKRAGKHSSEATREMVTDIFSHNFR